TRYDDNDKGEEGKEKSRYEPNWTIPKRSEKKHQFISILHERSLGISIFRNPDSILLISI
ncbi:1643_t:CDS:2, partial [Entrophospora sp. SA101]